MNHAPTPMLHDEESEDRSEECVHRLYKVAGPDLASVVGKEGLPVLRRLFPSAYAYSAHVPLNRALADLDTELQELASDALGTPEILGSHLLDEIDGFLGDSWLASPGSRPATPGHLE